MIVQEFQLEFSFSLVGKTSLNILSQVDEMFTLRIGDRVRRIEEGDAVWSNPGPTHRLNIRSRHGFETYAAAERFFSQQLEIANATANRLQGRLLGTGMHPWMAAKTARLWPHQQELAAHDKALHELFGKDRHGWANQQGIGLALPFESDLEFARLFAAMRFTMPLIPAFSAASPFADGVRGPAMSCRLAAARDYRSSVLDFATSLVPPPVPCVEAYRTEILAPLRTSLSAHSSPLGPLAACGHALTVSTQSPTGDSGIVQLRLLDMQESIAASLAVSQWAMALATYVSNEGNIGPKELAHWPAARLGELLEQTLLTAEQAVFRDRDFLQVWGFPERGACRAHELLQFLVEEKCPDHFTPGGKEKILHILQHGSMASRCLRELPERWTDEDLFVLYRSFADAMNTPTPQ